LLLVAACSRDERRPSEQRPMPSGMLVPVATGAADTTPVPTVSIDERFAAAPTKPGFASVKVASTSGEGGTWFVPLDAMTVVNEAFGVAKSGYDPLVAQRLEGEEVAHLDTALADLEKRLTETTDGEQARKRWPGSTPVRTHPPGQWHVVRDALLRTVRALRGVASAAKARGEGIAVAPPA
jgi:hypothetical protein